MNVPPPNPSQTGWYSINLPRRDRRLSWPRWLGTYWNGLPVSRQSSIQLVTEPGVEQLRWLRPTCYHYTTAPSRCSTKVFLPTTTCTMMFVRTHKPVHCNFNSTTRVVPSTWAARAHSSSKKLEHYFWAQVLDTLAQTFVTQLRDKFSLAWDDPCNDYNELIYYFPIIKGSPNEWRHALT